MSGTPAGDTGTQGTLRPPPRRPVIQYTCNGAVDEKWWYDSGSKTLRNVYSGKCLAIGATATKGTQLIQYTCNGKPDESWEQIPR
ncbi:RICIN domain-containing protein [Streptomyces sp. NBC_01210]|nr:RICIN domain-containing protein [Streptomyces sp. NBC_01210]